MGFGIPKPSRTERKLRKQQARREVEKYERDNKAKAKRRDGGRCRFPMCGCGRLKLRLESSHQEHKGMGGDPSMLRSETSNLITLCVHRHQDGAISRSKGTLEARPLSDAGCDGLVAWWVDLEWARDTLDVFGGDEFAPFVRRLAKLSDYSDATGETKVRLATEIGIGRTEVDVPWQAFLLSTLAEMRY
jgi:hypothetical protein